MPQDNQPLIRRIAVAGALLVIALVCAFLYMHSHTYPQNMQTSNISAADTLTNPAVLQNWLPQSAYTYTLKRIDDYVSSNNIILTSMTAQDQVNSGAGEYDFTLTLAPQGQVLNLGVTITNAGALLSTAVTINGTLQTPTVSSTISTKGNTMTFSGIDELVTDGVTTGQIGLFQQAFQKGLPAVKSVTIDTTRVDALLDSSNGNVVYGFPVNADGTKYNATLTCIGSDQAKLVLVNASTKKTVLDSGTLTSSE